MRLAVAVILSHWCREGESQGADYAIAAYQARAAAGSPVGSLLTTLRNLPTSPVYRGRSGTVPNGSLASGDLRPSCPSGV